MKITINTNYNSAATKVCVTDLIPKLIQTGHEVRHNHWNDYKNCDLVLFMAKDAEIEQVRRQNPKAVVGIMDPKLDRNKNHQSESADFLLVSSVEQRDALLSINPNIVIYYMFPETPVIKKIHQPVDKILIGYHGNKLHLHAFYPVISKALDLLSEKYNIELTAIYNINELGKWKKGLPAKIKVNHLQWIENEYINDLSKCDIGIVNNLKPIRNNLINLRIHPFWSEIFGRGYGYDYTDLKTRYKYNTNPGRIYVFSQLGIPVVSDFVPSAVQFIRHGYSGLLAHTAQGWYNALESLILDYRLRNEYSQNLKKYIDENYSISLNFNNLNEYLISLVNRRHDKKNH
ncbi:MAG: hypothetical protein U0W24_07835 [Bacteroidales bacterium]